MGPDPTHPRRTENRSHCEFLCDFTNQPALYIVLQHCMEQAFVLPPSVLAPMSMSLRLRQQRLLCVPVCLDHQRPAFGITERTEQAQPMAHEVYTPYCLSDSTPRALSSIVFRLLTTNLSNTSRHPMPKAFFVRTLDCDKAIRHAQGQATARPVRTSHRHR